MSEEEVEEFIFELGEKARDLRKQIDELKKIMKEKKLEELV